MIEYVASVFLLFIICSFAGWCLEVLSGYIDLHRFVNRGFLIGPICPIYGVGALAFNFMLGHFKNEPLFLAILIMFAAGVLEYATSYLMEKVFNIRWWDYSDAKLNFDGRICAEALVLFGILGVFAVEIAIPFIMTSLNSLPQTILIASAFVSISVFLIDLCLSTRIIFQKDKSTIENRDRTEEISLYVRGTLKDLMVVSEINFNMYKYFKLRSILEKINRKGKKPPVEEV